MLQLRKDIVTVSRFWKAKIIVVAASRTMIVK
jgi:hypothetical protein